MWYFIAKIRFVLLKLTDSSWWFNWRKKMVVTLERLNSLHHVYVFNLQSVAQYSFSSFIE